VSIDVLFICTGNICRSPLAERLAIARSRAPTDLVRFTSVGTHAFEGLSMDAASAMALRQLGGRADGHQARLLTGPVLEESDLILTATTEHRDFALRKRPASFRRVFTMKEFVRLGHGLTPATGPDDVLRVIAEVASQRGLVTPGGPLGDDIADPFGARQSEVRRCAEEISVAVDGTLELLGISRTGAGERGVSNL
jgi:protein-tyrosine phosphatase